MGVCNQCNIFQYYSYVGCHDAFPRLYVHLPATTTKVTPPLTRDKVKRWQQGLTERLGKEISKKKDYITVRKKGRGNDPP